MRAIEVHVTDGLYQWLQLSGRPPEVEVAHILEQWSRWMERTMLKKPKRARSRTT